MSHDLRTPVNRLRLRVGFLADPEAQGSIDAELDEMEAMIDATGAYLRGDIEPETPKLADLAAMLSTWWMRPGEGGLRAEVVIPRRAATADVRLKTLATATAGASPNGQSGPSPFDIFGSHAGNAVPSKGSP